jgi:gliding motility-associated-like protein
MDVFAIDEDEDALLNVLLNDTDLDNDIDISSMEITTPPTLGTATVDANGMVFYSPNANVNGSDTIIYTLCDLSVPSPFCDTAIVIIAIAPIDDMPMAIDDNAITIEDNAVTVFVLDNDVDYDDNIDASSLVVTVEPANGTYTLGANGEITYTPNPFYTGTDTLQYEVCDLSSPIPLCDAATVIFTVTAVYNPPTDIVIDTLFIAEDNPFSARVSNIRTIDNDLIDSFTYALVMGSGDKDNDQFSITGNTLYLETKTNFDIKQTYNFRVMVTDAYFLSYEKDFVLKVIDIEGNDIPLPSTNFISPNGDGKNDYWEVENIEIYAEFELTILDQFGFVLYAKDKGYDNSWDGTFNGSSLPTGNYYYLFRNDMIIYKGNITIVNN